MQKGQQKCIFLFSINLQNTPATFPVNLWDFFVRRWSERKTEIFINMLAKIDDNRVQKEMQGETQLNATVMNHEEPK